MSSIFRTLVLFVIVLFSTSLSAQDRVTGITYYMEYDKNTCWYDCFFIVDEGSASHPFFRSLTGAQYTIVIPTGSVLSVAETYMPLKSNQSYTGTVPVSWSVGPVAIDVSGLGNDYYPISPNLGVSAQFNDLETNDTIKIFSVSVANLLTCGTGVRFLDNGIDPNPSNGGDYSHGYTVGSPTQDFNGTAPEVYPGNPEITFPTIDLSNGININLELEPPTCNPTLTYSWTGPNGYESTDEDVMISPATSSDYGMYKVVVADGIQCQDSIEVLIEDMAPAQMAVDELSIVNTRITASFEHIGIHIDVNGDDNLNSTMIIEYRLTGTTDYLPSALVMRAHDNMIVDGAPLEYNFHAGSAMHLQPFSSYDIRITLTDPDGGSEVIEISAETKNYPIIGATSEINYVIPGNGGGDGTLGNPYLGLQFAVDNTQPGDILEVGDGVYSPFVIAQGGTEQAPIVIRSSNLHGAIIDGSNTSMGVITIGSATDSIQHIIIDGFDVKNGKWGIDAQNAQFLTVKNNKITDVDFGFYNRRENGWEHDQYLHNNEIIGRTPWPQTDGNIPDERGVDIRGNNNVISNNSISDFGDGISTDGPASQNSYGLDIFNNNITRIVDDIIEIDGTISNTRIYGNQGYNGRSGVSIAPVFGGPAYIFRNVLYNLETSAFKMNRGAAGLIILNNSVAKLDRGISSPAGWQNTIFKNNVVFSGHYVIEEFDLVDGSVDDWDNNAYWSARAGTSGEPWFKWNDIRYNNVDAINASGLTEGSSLGAEFSDFINLVMPTAYSAESDPADIDFRLEVNSGLVNGGVGFANIFDDVVEDSMPDIGALEYGETLPQYGHQFDVDCDRTDLSNRIWNGNESKGWYHPNNWTPCGVPSKLTTVEIPGVAPQYPFINTNVIISNLNILEGGKIDLSEGLELRLKGL